MSLEFSRDEMLDTYLLETTQILEDLQGIVLKYKDEPAFPDDVIAEIFRSMHTMKGSAGFMMFEQINMLAHKTEDVFYVLREHKAHDVDQKELIELVLKVADFIQGELDRLSEGEVADSDASGLIGDLDRFLSAVTVSEDKEAEGYGKKETGKGKKSKTEKSAKENASGTTKIYIAPKDTKASRYYQIYIIYAKDTKLANVHAYKIVHALKDVAEDIQYSPSTILTDVKSSDEIIDQGFKILLRTHSTKKEISKIVSAGYETVSIEIREIDAARFAAGFKLFGVDANVAAKHTKKDVEYAPGDFVVHSGEPGNGKVLAKDRAAEKIKSNHINVDIADMDKLADLIMKLNKVEAKLINDEEIRGAGLALETFDRNADKIKVITSSIQDMVMTMRMVPVTSVFLRMNRIIFEASRKLNKDIECELIGDEIKADRGIVERITDPLMHMVRNSADHGIEEAEVREAAGKNPKGKITIKAENVDGEFRVSVSDDGAGLDRTKILKKAHEKKLIDDSRPDEDYTDAEVWRFITLPGFSTNSDITEFSGRGVGMDVVVSAVEQIGGSLDIESETGKGSTMTMRFPL